MRVINGKYKGKRFVPPKKFPSRPTTDMAKEALFNILESKVYFEKLDILDLFSGTGNISLEFLSRGVGKVVSVDSHFVSWRFQLKTAESLNDKNWQALKQDAFVYLEKTIQKFDIIFADPPYGFEDLDKIPAMVFEKNVLVDDGMLIVEHSSRTSMAGLPHYRQTRDYGGVSFSFFEH
ncbi:MAG: methyltransferase domain-containing protein [Crocinitomix sp.]|nr:methyltransferase domain-containing protein [Crocinitomix sp.]